jgi:hypothetical protein
MIYLIGIIPITIPDLDNPDHASMADQLSDGHHSISLSKGIVRDIELSAIRCQDDRQSDPWIQLQFQYHFQVMLFLWVRARNAI